MKAQIVNKINNRQSASEHLGTEIKYFEGEQKNYAREILHSLFRLHTGQQFPGSHS